MNKDLNSNKLMLIEKSNFFSEEPVTVNLLNKYFTNIQLVLKISPQLKNLEDIINYYHDHIRLKKIRSSNQF